MQYELSNLVINDVGISEFPVMGGNLMGRIYLFSRIKIQS